MEFKRILLGKPFVLLLCVLLLIGVWLFAYRNLDGDAGFAYADIYNSTVEELAALPPEKALKICEESIKLATEQMIDGTWESSPENSYRLAVIGELKEQYEHILGYSDYISGIQKNAEKLQSVSLFSKPGTYAYENTVKTARDFAGLIGINVTPGHDKAVTDVLSDGWTDVAVLFPVLLVCVLFLSERREGLSSLVFATFGGRQRLAVKRVAILFAASVISVAVLFGARILMSGALYQGFFELERPLQSIPMFYNVPMQLTIGEFWIFYLAVKVLGAFFVGLLVWRILSAFSNIPPAVAVAGIIIGIEFVCTAIPSSSFFAIFRYANILSLVNYLPVFTRYLNLSVFGLIVSGNGLVCILLPFLCMAFSLLNVILEKKRYPVFGRGKGFAFFDRLRAFTDRKLSGGNLFLQETKKLLICRKGILLIALLLIVLPQLGIPVREGTPVDMYTDYYEERFAGPITQETVLSLEAELERAEEPERISALIQLLDFARGSKNGEWIVPSAPYEAFLTPQPYHYTVALIALMFTVLLVSPILSQEHQVDVCILQKSTPGGRAKLWRAKQLVTVLCVFLVWLAVYGSELLRLTEAYGTLQCLSAPTSSLAGTLIFNWETTLFGAFVLIYGIRFLVLLSIAELCFLLSAYCKKNSNAALACLSVAVVPAALAAIGSTFGETVSVLIPLTVVSFSQSQYSYLIVLVLLISAFLASRKEAVKI